MIQRIAIIAGFVVLCVAAAAGGYTIVARRNPVNAIVEIFVPTPQQVFGKSNLLVLVEGLDYDYTPSDEEYSKNSRSDVIWAVNLDFANKRIYELSIPRDMIATMPNGTQAKINEAQSDGGVTEAKTVIAGWLGIPGFDRYVVLRIDATKAFISAIGGVNVYVKTSDCLQYNTACGGGILDYDDTWGHLHIHLKEGMQHLSGEQAVAYMRFRHDWCSDPCRIKRQQQVLRALVDKIKGDRFNTFVHLGSLLGVFRTYVQTDFTDPELLSIANYYEGAASSAIVSNQVPYTGDVDIPGYGDSLVPDTAARAHLVATMLVAPPRPPASSPDTLALAAIPPSTLRVDVENGSGITGAARRVADVLQKAGFTIGEVGDAQRSDYTATEVHEHSSVTFAGARVREALPWALRDAAVVPDAPSASPLASPTPSSDVTVIIGSDFAKNS